jgi:hypothetical protein
MIVQCRFIFMQCHPIVVVCDDAQSQFGIARSVLGAAGMLHQALDHEHRVSTWMLVQGRLMVLC